MFHLASDQKAFTLIELMITVGIIGILVSLSSTSYERYSAKARQSEAKFGLSGIYALEKSFYAEYNAYIPSLTAIGYSREGLKAYYGIGWYASPFYTGSVTGYVGLKGGANLGRQNTPSDTNWGTVCNAVTSTPGLLPDANASPFDVTDPQSFIVGAAGAIKANGVCDIWRITDLKYLTNTQVGY